MAVRLSKSKLMGYLQCPRRLWLGIHRPELEVISEGTAAAFAGGHAVGDRARQLYGDGHLVAYADGLGAALDTTRALLADSRDNRPVYEATLEHDGLLVRLDVLLREPGGARLIEVKSTASIKDEHLPDCAVQLWVARGAGLAVSRVSLAHVNREFVYAGNGDYRGLLTEVDVTGQVDLLAEAVPQWLSLARAAAGTADEPAIQPGRRCTTPYACGYMRHCWAEDTAYPVSGLGGDRDKLGALLAAGYRDIRDVPPDQVSGVKQRRILAATRAGSEQLDPAARDFARALGWPRYYLDFETAGPAVPVFPGTRPFESLAFQFSCHVQQADGSVQHRGYLHRRASHPGRACAEALIDALEASGPVLTWSGYERSVINALRKSYPDLDASLKGILARLVDLHPLLRDHYYHPDMRGSWSLKAVLPVIAPDLSYAALGEINEGNAASNAWLELINPATGPERRAGLGAGLERYCALDTEGLLRIVRWLENGPDAAGT